MLHIFWNCTLTSLFWKSIFNWLRPCSLIQNENLDMITALGLSPDTSDAKLQINFCCLMSRYHIWLCKMKNEIPNFPQFLRFLKVPTVPTTLLKNGNLSLITFNLRYMTILNTVKVRAFCYLFCKSNLIKRRRPSQARSNKSTLNNCLFMSYFMLIFKFFIYFFQ